MLFSYETRTATDSGSFTGSFNGDGSNLINIPSASTALSAISAVTASTAEALFSIHGSGSTTNPPALSISANTEGLGGDAKIIIGQNTNTRDFTILYAGNDNRSDGLTANDGYIIVSQSVHFSAMSNGSTLNSNVRMGNAVDGLFSVTTGLKNGAATERVNINGSGSITLTAGAGQPIALVGNVTGTLFTATGAGPQFIGSSSYALTTSSSLATISSSYAATASAAGNFFVGGTAAMLGAVTISNQLVVNDSGNGLASYGPSQWSYFLKTDSSSVPPVASSPLLTKNLPLYVVGASDALLTNDNFPGGIGIITFDVGGSSIRGSTINFCSSRASLTSWNTGGFSPVQTGDELGDIYFGGDNGTTLRQFGAEISARVTTTWNTASNPADIYIDTADVNQTAPSHRWIVRHEGHLYAGSDNSYDIGTTGANRPRNLYIATSGTFGGNVTAVSFTGNLIGSASYASTASAAGPFFMGGPITIASGSTLNLTGVTISGAPTWSNGQTFPTVTSNGIIYSGPTVSDPYGNTKIYGTSTTSGNSLGFSLYVNDGTNNRRAQFYLDDSIPEFGVRGTASTEVPTFVLTVGNTRVFSGTSAGNIIIPSGGIQTNPAGGNDQWDNTNVQTVFHTRTNGAPARYFFRSARGTIALPSASQAGDALGNIQFQGYDGVIYRTAALIQAQATQPYSSGSGGGSLAFYTTPSGTVTNNLVLTLGQDQSATFTANVIAASFTGSLLGSSSFALASNTSISSSFATTSSAATSITFIPATASYAQTASAAGTFFVGGTLNTIGNINIANGGFKSTFSTIYSFDTTDGQHVYQTRANATPEYVFRQSSGTLSAPLPTLNGSSIGWLEFDGYDGVAYQLGALITAVTTQQWATGSQGSQIIFQTVPNNSTTKITALTLGQDQSATFGGILNAFNGGARFGPNVTVGNNLAAIQTQTALRIASTITASSAQAFGLLINPLLTAAANNDTLFGLNFTSNYSPGTFTGVSPIGIQVGSINTAGFTSPGDVRSIVIGNISATGITSSATNAVAIDFGTVSGALNDYSMRAANWNVMDIGSASFQNVSASSFTGNLIGSASYALTASAATSLTFAPATASYALTSSNSPTFIIGPVDTSVLPGGLAATTSNPLRISGSLTSDGMFFTPGINNPNNVNYRYFGKGGSTTDIIYNSLGHHQFIISGTRFFDISGTPTGSSTTMGTTTVVVGAGSIPVPIVPAQQINTILRIDGVAGNGFAGQQLIQFANTGTVGWAIGQSYNLTPLHGTSTDFIFASGSGTPMAVLTSLGVFRSTGGFVTKGGIAGAFGTLDANPINITLNSGVIATFDTGSDFNMLNGGVRTNVSANDFWDSTNTGSIFQVRAGAVPTYAFRQSQGTIAAPTATSNFAGLGQILFGGYDATSSYVDGTAAILSLSTQAFASGAHGTKLLLQTTQNNTTTPVTAITIDQDQSVTFAKNVVVATEIDVPTVISTSSFGVATPLTSGTFSPTITWYFDRTDITIGSITNGGGIWDLNFVMNPNSSGSAKYSNIYHGNVYIHGDFINGIVVNHTEYNSIYKVETIGQSATASIAPFFTDGTQLLSTVSANSSSFWLRLQITTNVISGSAGAPKPNMLRLTQRL